MTQVYQVYRDTFWDNVERPGYNPYDNPGTDDGEFLAAMERVWKECCKATTPAPAFIIPSIWFWDAYYEHLATPDRGHEFEPYARA